ncbi:MAG: TIGR00269 family protein [Desulfurococcales archaeon]|nr:TIGR00269 family protein [Desulfurococcales archaeon]
MTVPLCDSCRSRPAVVYQRHTGMRLCRECFMEDIRARVAREVSKWRMLEPGDTLLLAVSGGKDSFVLLDVMPLLHKPSRMLALSIVEGIPGYNRHVDIQKMKGYARERGIDLIVTSIREYTGLHLSEIVSRAWKRRLRIAPCTYCGILRRRIINYYARVYGASKTVTAHNLDDEAQTAIINLLRGDLIGLLRQHPLAPPASRRLVPRVKPLRKIYEWETATYAYLAGFRFQETECMYIRYAPTLRARVRNALYIMEAESPGSLLRLVEALDSLLEEDARRLSVEDLPPCSRCGEPTSPGRMVCKLCEILSLAGVEKPVYSTPWRGLPDFIREALRGAQGGGNGGGTGQAAGGRRAARGDGEEAEAQAAGAS